MRSIGVSNPTDTQLQQLSSKISSIILEDDAEIEDWAIDIRLQRAKIIKDLLGIELNVDKETGKTLDIDSASIIEDIKNITDQYYQYTQFKRAVFDCEGMTYNQGTKRVVSMTFKLQTKIENGNVMVVFD